MAKCAMCGKAACKGCKKPMGGSKMPMKPGAKKPAMGGKKGY